jgi:hypothetical protein
MSIPQVEITFLSNVKREELEELYRVDTDGLTDIITAYNRDAEIFVQTYLGNNVDGLTEDNWEALKEYFIEWKLYDSLELDEETKDKKDTLVMLLDNIKDQSSNKDGGRGMLIFSGDE